MPFKKRAMYAIAAAPILAAMVLFLLSPARYGACVLEGISLWASCVLPATFPFLFLTALLTRGTLYDRAAGKAAPFFSKFFRVSGAGGCAAILSALSGYPVGARTTLDLTLSGQVSHEERFRVACLASTTGPMFLVGAVGGGMFSSPSLGWLMLACHYFGVFFVCFLLRFTGSPQKSVAAPAQKRGNALYDSLYSSVISILCVGGSIALFYAFSQMVLDLLPPMPPYAEGAVRGLFEMTAGCKAFSADPSPFALAGCVFLTTFGGLCVLVQQLAFLSQAGIRTGRFVAVKLVQAILAGGICYLLGMWIL